MARRYATLRVPSVSPALLDLGFSVSPRVEHAAPGLIHVDLEGLARHPDERRLAEDLLARAGEAGLSVSVAIASTRTVTRVAASAKPLTVVPAGSEAAFLAPFPVEVLAPPEALTTVLARWGIRTLGALAALPDAALIERLGMDGRRLQRQARGEDLAPFVPYQPTAVVDETVELDWPIDTVEAVAFVLGSMLDRLVTRLTWRGWALGGIHLTLGLVNRSSKNYALSLASPLSDGRAALPVVVQQVRSSPPDAAIERMNVRVDPAAIRISQSGLFSASRVSPEQLSATLVRLEALVGPGDVGSPVVLDSHGPDAFTIHRFDGAAPPIDGSKAATGSFGVPAAPVLRRCRPPIAIDVATGADGTPERVLGGPWAGRVRTASGPWRLSGDWWTEAGWRREEWDAELSNGRVIRLVFDRTRDGWLIEGVYD